MTIQKKCEFRVDINSELVKDFARISGDQNPLHVDLAYAETTEFKGPVAHGALLISFVSRVLGMYIPGKKSLIISMKIKFPQAALVPTVVLVEGENQYYDAGKNVGCVAITITDIKRSVPVLEAEVTYTLHGNPLPACEEESLREKVLSHANLSASKNGKPNILVTGGTGGIGQILIPKLTPQYHVLCLTRKIPGNVVNGVQYVEVDLENQNKLDAFLLGQSPSDFYGIIHMSSPPLTRGFISRARADVERHLRHSVYVPLTLAEWAQKENSSIRRLILFGSTAGKKEPDPQKGAYCFGKASVENLAPLLAWDMARQNATVNIVVPGFIATGLNKGVPDRVKRTLEGKIPTARITEPQDIYQVVHFLLSKDSKQINGTSIVVDGGQID